MQAVDLEGLDVELDLSNLGTMNTMFAALFRCVLLSLVFKGSGRLCYLANALLLIELSHFSVVDWIRMRVSMKRVRFCDALGCFA